MARYGGDFGYGPGGTLGRGRPRGTGQRSAYSPGPGYDIGPRGGGRGRNPQRGGGFGWDRDAASVMNRDWETGQPWGGEGTADRIRAGDLMTANPEAVTPDTPLSEVATRMRDLDVGIIPVVDDLDELRLKGVITDRDITIRAAADGKDMKKTRASTVMSSDVETIHENDHVRDVFSVMKRARVRRVPVVNDEGRLVGIIAQADLAVDYAGLDLQREAEVEEVVERISEPARPQWGGRQWGPAPRGRYVAGGPGYDRGFHPAEIGDRLRGGWHRLRHEARHLMERGYDRGWWR